MFIFGIKLIFFFGLEIFYIGNASSYFTLRIETGSLGFFKTMVLDFWKLLARS